VLATVARKKGTKKERNKINVSGKMDKSSVTIIACMQASFAAVLEGGMFIIRDINQGKSKQNCEPTSRTVHPETSEPSECDQLTASA
jgi:hypothetical protein